MMASYDVASNICLALSIGRVRVAHDVQRQGLTLVHVSAQPEPFPTQEHTLNIP